MGNEGRAGITVYQINDGHADLFCEGGDAVLRCRMKSLDVELGRVKDVLHKGKCRLRMEADKDRYRFLCKKGDEWPEVGSLECSLLSTEVVGGFTGVVLGLRNGLNHQSLFLSNRIYLISKVFLHAMLQTSLRLWRWLPLRQQASVAAIR